MLLKSKISEHQISLDPMLNEKYYRAKLGRFTSSEWHYLMGGEKIDKGGLSYIYRKVGEAMLNFETKDEDLLNNIKVYLKHKQDVSTIATEHGLNYEREGIIKFGEKMIAGGKMKENTEVKVQWLLLEPDVLDEEGNIIEKGRCGGTPDGLWINSEREDSYTVRPIEVKCPISFDGYIKLFKCKTPADVRKVERDGIKYFYQILHQMVLCESLIGYLVAYHPFLKSGQINIVEFNSQEESIRKEMKLINERRLQAIEIYNQTLKELTNG